MKKLRNHWRIVVAFAFLLIAGGAFLWRAEAKMSFWSFAMLEEIGYSPLNRVEHDAIVGSLNQLSLDRDALIALNLSSQQATSVYSTARTWQQGNQATLTSQMNTVHQKTHAVRVLEKAIAMGPYNENHASQLATAREELRDAKETYQNTLDGLATSISNGFSESQRTTWAAIKTGWGQQMPIRMLDLTDEQRLAVSDAHHRYQRQHAAATNDQERATAVSTWTSALESILNPNQETIVQSYLANYATASEAVANAYNTVLPVQSQQVQEN